MFRATYFNLCSAFQVPASDRAAGPKENAIRTINCKVDLRRGCEGTFPNSRSGELAFAADLAYLASTRPWVTVSSPRNLTLTWIHAPLNLNMLARSLIAGLLVLFCSQCVVLSQSLSIPGSRILLLDDCDSNYRNQPFEDSVT